MTVKEQKLQQVRDNNPTDYSRLYGFAKDWVKTMMRPFTSEDLKQAYEAHNPLPRQPNIYGSLMNALSNDGLIKHNDFVPAKLPSAHGRIIHQWISIEYSAQQSKNRMKPDDQVDLFDMKL